MFLVRNISTYTKSDFSRTVLNKLPCVSLNAKNTISDPRLVGLKSNDGHLVLKDPGSVPAQRSSFSPSQLSIYTLSDDFDFGSPPLTPLHLLILYPFNFLTARRRRGSIRPMAELLRAALHSRSPPRRFDREKEREKEPSVARDGGGEGGREEKKERSTPTKWSAGWRVGPQVSVQAVPLLHTGGHPRVPAVPCPPNPRP